MQALLGTGMKLLMMNGQSTENTYTHVHLKHDIRQMNIAPKL